MEKIVRPFLTEKTDPKQGTESIPDNVPNVVLLLGANGQGKTFNGSYSAHSTLYEDRDEQEQGGEGGEGGE